MESYSASTGCRPARNRERGRWLSTTYPNNNGGRTLPHSIEAEENLLSCCMLDGADVMARCIEARIGPGAFYDPKHGVIFDCALALYHRKALIDASVIAEELKVTRQLEQIGGIPFLSQVSRRIPTTAQAGYFIEKVREQALLREMIRTGTALVENAHNYKGGGVAEHLAPAFSQLRTALEDPTSGARKGFSVWKPSQFLEYAPPSDAVILGESLIERGKWTSLVGVGGLGKTRWALFLAICQIVSREDCCGLRLHGKPLRWLILSTENGLRRWKSDLSAMVGNLDASQRASLDTYLAVMAATDEDDGDLNTGNSHSMARLATTLREQRPDVVVFDPFADMIDGDENQTQDVVVTLRTLRQIVRKSAPSAAVLLIHHARTGAGNVAQAGDNYASGNFGRGAKALYSSVRAEIQLAPGDRDDGNLIVMACGKNSDGPKFAARGIVFNPDDCSYSVDPTFDLDAWRADVTGQRTGKSCSIVNAVNAVRNLAPAVGDEAKTKDIVEDMQKATDASVRTCKTRLSDAVQAGYLRRVSGRAGIYRLGAKPLPRQE
jgi:hypothetical protein